MNMRQLQAERGSPDSATPAEKQGGMRLSMHNGVAVSCDCCSCEAEPYWLAAAGEADNGDCEQQDVSRAAPQGR